MRSDCLLLSKRITTSSLPYFCHHFRPLFSFNSIHYKFYSSSGLPKCLLGASSRCMQTFAHSGVCTPQNDKKKSGVCTPQKAEAQKFESVVLVDIVEDQKLFLRVRRTIKALNPKFKSLQPFASLEWSGLSLLLLLLLLLLPLGLVPLLVCCRFCCCCCSCFISSVH